ncbi:hypothetical protein WR25_18636 [Diploscapter pachys]|uniref:Uncharacterized protein n=1 Tax=Diploscapter pachys TaxID=2018661 RepID=A0A2A2L4Q0_9BILA|nr:hypothetical protein WR25_18636 [Diploscapter pachys]
MQLAKQPYRTGESILLAPGSANLSYVLEILEKAKVNEKKKAAKTAQSSTSLVQNSVNSTSQKIAPRSTQGYSRYDQELFVRDRTVEFLFDSGASFMSSANLNPIKKVPVKPIKKQSMPDECFDVKR